MAPLTSEQLLLEHQSSDPSSITSLKLSLRALSDVSCLVGFRGLERLDLSCNNIRTLEGLACCGNLKWLSVAQNKIESLKGVEGLSKLTVLNAGQNTIQLMTDVTVLTSLRALILNDNKISAICKLEPLKYLNTLVLSRNPIIEIGKSLVNMKSLTKISFSNCKIQEIGSSFISCEALKEARFANNEITTIPNQIVKNSKLQLLDLGKNAISRWSDLKVLSELHNLRNLNLQGNPIADKDKIVKKVRKLVPNLQIFNAKPIEKFCGTRNSWAEDVVVPGRDYRSPLDGGSHAAQKGEKRKKDMTDSGYENSLSLDGTKKKVHMEGLNLPDKAMENENLLSDISEPKEVKETKKHHEQKPKKSKGMKPVASATGTIPFENDESRADFKLRKNVEEKAIDSRTKKATGFDDDGSSFMDLVLSGKEGEVSEHKSEGCLDSKFFGGLVIDHAKEKKKMKKKVGVISGRSALTHMAPSVDVGMGGPSAWND